jgi:hypothetical protein
MLQRNNGDLGFMNRSRKKAVALGFAAFVVSAAGAGPAFAGGINILNPFFGSWFLGGDKEKTVVAEVAGIEPNAGVRVNGVRCNYGYVMRGGERIRQEICESTR